MLLFFPSLLFEICILMKSRIHGGFCQVFLLFLPTFQSLLLYQLIVGGKNHTEGVVLAGNKNLWDTVLFSWMTSDGPLIFTLSWFFPFYKWIHDYCIPLQENHSCSSLLYLHPYALWDVGCTFPFLNFHIDTLFTTGVFYLLACNKAVLFLMFPDSSGKFHCGWCAPFHFIFLLP